MQIQFDIKTLIEVLLFLVGIGGVYVSITNKLTGVQKDIQWIKEILRKNYSRENINQ
ncbi:MAG: hypothetical protein GYA14_12870 [Ignavibacteria bacterium]|nr:hypothetical protein [Ignavibacteria bacterium]